MSDTEDHDSIYILLYRKNDELAGHAVMLKRPQPKDLEDLAKPDSAEAEQEGREQELSATNSFSGTVSSFASVMATYRKAIALTIRISPTISSAIAASEISDFSEERGKELPEMALHGCSVYKLPRHCFGAIMRKHESARAAAEGAKHLPQIATIGLISAYDAYLSDLLRNVFFAHPVIVFSSEREIKYSELVEYSSLEDAKASIIDSEVEAVLRKSHHEQFSWMEKKFRIPLREGLDVWPEFIELCERRNLLTHTNGIVSQQYLRNCAVNKWKTDAKVGDRLAVDHAYFTRAVEIVAEVGLKLGHVMWRKFMAAERKQADEELIDLAVDLIGKRVYNTAERVLDLGVKFKAHSSDRARRMMVINLANAVNLGGNGNRANEILKKEDWSAASPDFQICVSAIRGEVDELCRLMRQGGKDGPVSSSSYRDWPVFRTIRKKPEFARAFEEVFGEPILTEASLEVKVSKDGNAPIDEARAEDNNSTQEIESAGSPFD